MYNVGRVSSVGIGNCYGLDGPGGEGGVSALVQTGRGAHPAPCTMYRVIPGGKAAGASS